VDLSGGHVVPDPAAGPTLAPACDTRPASNQRGAKSRSLSTG
jgi:hypothetical protein